jgi:hypothetical protein
LFNTKFPYQPPNIINIPCFNHILPFILQYSLIFLPNNLCDPWLNKNSGRQTSCNFLSPPSPSRFHNQNRAAMDPLKLLQEDCTDDDRETQILALRRLTAIGEYSPRSRSASAPTLAAQLCARCSSIATPCACSAASPSARQRLAALIRLSSRASPSHIRASLRVAETLCRVRARARRAAAAARDAALPTHLRSTRARASLLANMFVASHFLCAVARVECAAIIRARASSRPFQQSVGGAANSRSASARSFASHAHSNTSAHTPLNEQPRRLVRCARVMSCFRTCASW